MIKAQRTKVVLGGILAAACFLGIPAARANSFEACGKSIVAPEALADQITAICGAN